MKDLAKPVLKLFIMAAFLSMAAATPGKGQAMVSKGQEVLLIWFNGVTATSYHNIQVETANGSLQFVVTFQLPDGAPGVSKGAYTLPLFWISDFGIFQGTGTVTPNGQVIARFHVKAKERA